MPKIFTNITNDLGLSSEFSRVRKITNAITRHQVHHYLIPSYAEYKLSLKCFLFLSKMKGRKNNHSPTIENVIIFSILNKASQIRVKSL